MSTNMEKMQKLIDEKKAKGLVNKGKKKPDKYGNQSNGSGKISTTAYGK